MSKKILISFCILLYFCSTVFGQNCGNIGFEDGTFDGWTLTNGNVTDNGIKMIYSAEISGTTNNEHLITSASTGNDPKITTEAIPTVAPGSKYSIRLGYTVQGGRFDRIKKTFIVSQDNSLFQYRFAVILQQDNTHTDIQKPGFNIHIFDKNGNPLTCSVYDVQLTRNAVADGFKTITTAKDGDIQYRNWTTGAMDLRAYIGQAITIEVEVHGCTRQKHFGYAYFDADCIKSEIKPVASCPDADGIMTLKAPDGFANYTWSTGETSSTIKVKANLDDNYFVKLLPYSSLNNSCELRLDYKIQSYKATNTINKVICEGNSFQMGNTAYLSSGTYIKTISRGNVCDSTITLNLKVNPIAKYTQSKTICEGESIIVGSSIYKTDGIYTNIITRAAIGDIPTCDSIVTTTLIVEKAFKVTLQPKYSVSKGESIQLIPTVEPAGTYLYLWSPTDDLSCTTCLSPIAKPSLSRTYVLTVSNTNNRCPVKESTTVIMPNTGIMTPNAFTPNNDLHNDIFYVLGDATVKQIKELQIFNRWGQLIFQNTNFPPSDPAQGWNGTFQGKAVEPDTYTYKLQVEFMTGELDNYIGSFVLLK